MSYMTCSGFSSFCTIVNVVSCFSIEEMSAKIPLMSVTRISRGETDISRNLPLGDQILPCGLCKFLDYAFMKYFFTPHNFVTLVVQTHADPWTRSLCFAFGWQP